MIEELRKKHAKSSETLSESDKSASLEIPSRHDCFLDSDVAASTCNTALTSVAITSASPIIHSKVLNWVVQNPNLPIANYSENG